MPKIKHLKRRRSHHTSLLLSVDVPIMCPFSLHFIVHFSHALLCARSTNVRMVLSDSTHAHFVEVIVYGY